MKYEISNGTLAIVPNDGNSSVVYEDEERYIIDDLPFKIMEDSCKYFGSTYKGRKDGAKEILGAEYKVPIVIDNSNDLIVFPTTSPLAEDCIWVSLNIDMSLTKEDIIKGSESKKLILTILN